MSKKQRRWTNEEIEFLKENYSTMTAEEISETLSITKQSVFTKAFEFKLKNKVIIDSEITLQTVIDYLREYKVKVLSKKYINSNSKIQLQCKCGRIFKRTFSKCKSNSPICVGCTKDERLNYEQLLLEDISYLEEKGLTIIIHEKYCGKTTKFKILCQCGKSEVKSMTSLRKNACCTTCAKTNCGKRNLTNDEISEVIIANSSCKLLSDDYANRDSIIRLECNCGNEFETYIDRFLVDEKRQCNDCGVLRRSGELNPNWKGGITSESSKLRHSKEYVIWRNAIYKRDNYTCQCCNDSTGGNLQAHHIVNFSDNKEEIFNLENGISMCNLCHDFRYKGSYHHAYGTSDNDIYELQEYFDDIRSELGLPLVNIEDIVYQK